ncbi:MAG TPA: hypothetical protein VH280_00450 [Verrucomicrobiae bacterium]|jgi:hypothetical protein|nr:hypothetical protein [Verrucomicrobiae bacterium]
MKQKYPVSASNQSVSHLQSNFISGANELGARQHFYRSVILAVSGSLICVAAGESAAAQSAAGAPQTSNLTLGEIAQLSPPAIFPGLNDMIADSQWPSRPLAPAETPIYSSDPSPATPVPSSSVNVNVASVPSVSATPAASADANADANLALPGLPISQPAVYKNELSASADFMYGRGTITVPIGYGLKANSLPGASFPVNAVSADRSTVYYGGTISYSYGRSWYLDISGENGRSTGSTSITVPNLTRGLGAGSFPANFNVNDTLYQAYLRYNLKNFLAGSRFQAYLRGGLSLVDATLTTANASLPFYAPGAFYSEHDKTFDILGNVGFGLTYSLHSTFRLKMGLQLEGEGFGGNRSQDINETASGANGSTTINNTVYGAIGRLTLHTDYKLGQTGRWKLTGDIGVSTKYSFVSYPDSGTKDELLYGPYAKAGVSFVF